MDVALEAKIIIEFNGFEKQQSSTPGAGRTGVIFQCAGAVVRSKSSEMAPFLALKWPFGVC
jgi:hypothetical protein